jgi:ribosomal protein S18 acetylase RimI-like enzyme
LYALPRVWGMGAGAALLRAALVDLAAAGHDACALWVLAGNARGLAFYRRAGFAEAEGSRQAFEIGGRQLDEVQMRLEGAAFATAAVLAGVVAASPGDSG